MGVEPHQDVELEEMFTRVIASQQPFFQSMLNQMQALETRLHAMDTNVGEIKINLASIAGAQLAVQIAAHNKRLDNLEAEQHRRQGMKELVDWIPKLVMWAAVVLVLALGYLNLKSH